jgi:hypothetical protein
MAITGTDRGTGTHNTSATSFTLNPASDFAAGSFAVLVIAADNSASGGARPFTTATDTLGNTWIDVRSILYDPGSANAGVAGAFYYTSMRTGTLVTGTTITVNFSVATTNKCWTLMEVVPTSALYRILFVKSASGTGSATAAPTITTGSITSGNMVIGGLFNEYGTAQTVTQDGDTTNGTWSAQQTAEVGTTTSGMTVQSQCKVVTATATQTYNPTLATSSDVILAWIELTEVLIPKQLTTLGVGP